MTLDERIQSGYYTASQERDELRARIAELEKRAEAAERAFALQPTTLENESFREALRSQLIKDYLESESARDADTRAAEIRGAERLAEMLRKMLESEGILYDASQIDAALAQFKGERDA